MRQLQYNLLLLAILMVSFLTSCAPLVVGTAAVGTYKGVTDERSSGTMLDDSVLATKIKTRLINEKSVKARHIDVDVYNSVVYLIGVVESEQQRKTASDIAKGVGGVSMVSNQLVIGRTSVGQSFDDLMLSSRIKTGLVRHPEVKSLNIDVDVNQNVITLTGITKTLAEKETIMAIARDHSGSAKITDNIRIQGQ
jgi:hyperosmotically inducible protein